MKRRRKTSRFTLRVWPVDYGMVVAMTWEWSSGGFLERFGWN